MCEAGMCVCIKRLINSTFLKGVSLAPPPQECALRWPELRCHPESFYHFSLYRVMVTRSGSWLILDSKVPGSVQKGPTVLGAWFLQTWQKARLWENHTPCGGAVASAIVLRAWEYFYFRSWEANMGGVDLLIGEHQMSPYSWFLWDFFFFLKNSCKVCVLVLGSVNFFLSNTNVIPRPILLSKNIHMYVYVYLFISVMFH